MTKEIEEYYKKSNPFYDNHLFGKDDINRTQFNKWCWLWLWIFPTFVQVSDSYAFHYKIVNGAYWLIEVEDLGITN